MQSEDVTERTITAVLKKPARTMLSRAENKNRKMYSASLLGLQTSAAARYEKSVMGRLSTKRKSGCSASGPGLR